MAVVRWTLWDPVLGTTLEFPINPAQSFLPQREKSFSTETTTAGQVVAFEGEERPNEFDFSGTFLNETSYNFMNTWFDKRYQLLLTDDLGNEIWIYLKSFLPERKRSSNYPWAFTYKASAMVMDIPD